MCNTYYFTFNLNCQFLVLFPMVPYIPIHIPPSFPSYNPSLTDTHTYSHIQPCYPHTHIIKLSFLLPTHKHKIQLSSPSPHNTAISDCRCRMYNQSTYRQEESLKQSRLSDSICTTVPSPYLLIPDIIASPSFIIVIIRPNTTILLLLQPLCCYYKPTPVIPYFNSPSTTIAPILPISLFYIHPFFTITIILPPHTHRTTPILYNVFLSK